MQEEVQQKFCGTELDDHGRGIGHLLLLVSLLFFISAYLWCFGFSFPPPSLTFSLPKSEAH